LRQTGVAPTGTDDQAPGDRAGAPIADHAADPAELERTGGRYGLQTMCEGGGQANVTIIEGL
jgi:acetyl-CoA C-acetyltransferase